MPRLDASYPGTHLQLLLFPTLATITATTKAGSITCSRSNGRTYCSVDVYPTQGLSTAQAAALEERMNQMELEDIHLQIKQETQADKECKVLENRFREEEWLQEEAQRRKEEVVRANDLLTMKMEGQKCLARAEQDLEIGRLRSSVLSDGGRVPLSFTSQTLSWTDHQCRQDRLTRFHPLSSHLCRLSHLSNLSPQCSPHQLGKWNIPAFSVSLAPPLPSGPASVTGSYFN